MDDFEGSEVVVTFPALSSPGTQLCASISIADDNIVEDTESFTTTVEDIASPTVTMGAGFFPNGDTATVNILDNDGNNSLSTVLSVQCASIIMWV